MTSFITKCIEKGLKYTLHMWDRGVWHVHGIRVGGMSKRNFDIICQHLDNPYEVGKQIGGELSTAVRIILKKESTEERNWNYALKEVESISGWGNYLVEDNVITVVSPVLPPEFLRGFLERFLGIHLETVSEEPLIVQVVRK